MATPTYTALDLVEVIDGPLGSGLIVIDGSPLGAVRDEYGPSAHEDVSNRFADLIEGSKGKHFRSADIVFRDPRDGLDLRFGVILGAKRDGQTPSVSDLQAARTRLSSTLLGTLGRAGLPYLKTSRVGIGQGLVIASPCLHSSRVVERAIEQGLAHIRHAYDTEDLECLSRLQDILLRERIVTVFQPILRLDTRTVMGFEALSRGPYGSGMETADALFGTAGSHGLLPELDSLCRRRALIASARIPWGVKLFVNTLPGTLLDPRFRGKALTKLLTQCKLKPERIIIEITEHLIIKNYNAFREILDYYSDFGIQFAVDDVGTGYSGLEAIAKLKPNFLKIDTSLVHDVHLSPINRPMVKALVELGHAIGAEIIAEGVSSEEEASALHALGADYGQGYYFARPDPEPE